MPDADEELTAADPDFINALGRIVERRNSRIPPNKRD
jgi:hypothetical protein